VLRLYSESAVGHAFCPAIFVQVHFDWEHAILGNPVLYNTDRLQKSNGRYWLRLQVYF